MRYRSRPFAACRVEGVRRLPGDARRNPVASPSTRRGGIALGHGRAVWLCLLGLLLGVPQLAAASGNWAPVAPMASSRTNATASLLPTGEVLVAGGGGFSGSAEIYDPLGNTWRTTASLPTSMSVAVSALLPDGRVLVAGGRHSQGLDDYALDLAQIHDLATGTWTATAPMLEARQDAVAVRLLSGKILVVSGSNYEGYVTIADLYDPASHSWSATGPMALGRERFTATLLPDGRVLAVGGYNAYIGIGSPGSEYLASAEIYDPQTSTWSLAAPMSAGRADAATMLLPNGKVLVAGGQNSTGTVAGAELYDPVSDSWSPAASMVTSRQGAMANLLPTGRVLVAGGFAYGGPGRLASTELYDPVTDTWSPGPAMADARTNATATVLPTGRVLAIGGSTTGGSGLARAELYDPASDSWTTTQALAAARQDAMASLLPSGRVLVAGGRSSVSGDLGSAEVFDPASATWAATGALLDARRQATATLLPGGQVLVAGGCSDERGPFASAELYDPQTGQWTATGMLGSPRTQATATLLATGKVLVVGGDGGLAGYRDSAELYDPATALWSGAGTLAAARIEATATLLPGGQVLVAGGRNGGGVLAGAERYSPVTNGWSAAAPMGSARSGATAMLLPNGRVLVAGGHGGGSTWLASAEVYDPASNAWSSAGSMATARAEATATMLPGGQVLVVGGRNASGSLASAELYDPVGNHWRVVTPLQMNRADAMAVRLPSGQVLLAGGAGSFSSLASAELYDPGLAPVPTLQPQVQTVSTTLSVTSALVASSPGSSYDANGATLSTGFVPVMTASSDDRAGSPGNVPVFQVERIDGQQQRFVAKAGNVDFSDTQFTGSANALTGFPAGPVLVRAWVNGVPSEAHYATLVALPGYPQPPTATGGMGRASVDFTPVADSVTSYTATASPGGATASCMAPCTQIVFEPMLAGTYTFTVRATNTVGDGHESQASNAVQVVQTTLSLGVDSTSNPAVYGQGVTFFAQMGNAVSPTGDVSFCADAGTPDATCSGGMLLCVVPATATPLACSSAVLAVGSHAITAHYAGDDVNTAAASAALTQVVAKAATAIGMPALAPISYGQSVTVTATVGVVAPGAGLPTGSIAVDVGGAGCTIVLPAATCVLTPVAIGTLALDATYSGDGNFAGGSGATALVVTPALPTAQPQAVTVPSATPTPITLSASDSNPGGPHSFSFAVATPPAHGALAIDGNTATYTPQAGYGGADAFTFTASNANGASTPATVDITVTRALLRLGVDDGRAFARYGQMLDYLVTLRNDGDEGASGITLSGSASVGLDVAQARWRCINGGSGSCTATGSGALVDSVNLPAGQTLNWIVSIPVRADANEPQVSFGISGDGAANAEDIDVLVIYRDGFDDADGDGTLALDLDMRAPAEDGAGTVFVLPPPPASGHDSHIVRQDGDGTIRLDRLVLNRSEYVRLRQVPLHGEDRASNWLQADPGAVLAIGHVASGAHREVLLESPSGSSSLRLRDAH